MKKKVSIISNIIIIGMLTILSVIALPIKTTTKTSANPNVIYYGDTTKSNVSFMINVYWGNEYINDMLDVFDSFDVKTTFFVGGSWACKNVDLLKEIYSRGHEIGNHGYNHKDHDKLSKQQNIDEISFTHKLIEANLGIEMDLFAPPSGAYNDAVVDIASELGYKTIMWTHDTIDWRDKDKDLITKRATQNLSNGDLILMHPTQATLDALNSILSYSRNNGFEATTVSNTLNFTNQK